MKTWLPKNERKKILLLSDDMRVHSGIGVMAKEIVEQTCGVFNWTQVGAAVNHPEAGHKIDVSAAVATETGVEDPQVHLYPQNGYGNTQLMRYLMETEKPDAVLHFTDPRYWMWLYQIENEIRQKVPLMFYSIWDNLPYPHYNETFYRSDDAIFAISKQTYNIVKQVCKKEPRAPWSLKYIPHGVDHVKKFYPIQEDDKAGQELLAQVRSGLKDLGTFTVLYVARNIRRKQTSDLLLAYNHFLTLLPPEEAAQCRLILHTAPVDENGTDLPAVIRDVTPNVKAIFSNTRVEPNILNGLYNIADVCVNIASNEGFGLGTCESLAAGTPIIVNVTGGLQDQCGFVNDEGQNLDPERDFNYEWGSNHTGRFRNHGEWAFPVWPVSVSLQGSPITPYIFDDRCDWVEVGAKLLEVYNLGRDERKRRGLLGREYVLGEAQFTSEKMGESFVESINEVFENWTPRKRYSLIKV